LTRREHEVLQQLAEGRSSQEIAAELFISLKTVKNHLGSIYTKLEAHNRTQAVLSGMRLGLVRIAS
ncbi:MAG: response regulator transcription factor, partial [Acidimicrobiia bacterium]|nr:response regulator transcription factor [Acidimicrobiia bacterium]